MKYINENIDRLYLQKSSALLTGIISNFEQNQFIDSSKSTYPKSLSIPFKSLSYGDDFLTLDDVSNILYKYLPKKYGLAVNIVSHLDMGNFKRIRQPGLRLKKNMYTSEYE
jgi:hypothetical protein